MWSADFRAYGQLATQHVEEVKKPLRFQGQYFDDESGLHYNRHRYYCPKTGRFISPDPIGLAGGLNSYQYVVNPTGCVDPLGLVQGRENCPGNGSADNPAGEPEFQRVSVEPEIPGSTTDNNGKVLWGSWSDYKKINIDGQEYAQVGNRLYSKHAVNRMQPGRRRHSSSGKTGGLPEIYQAGTHGDYGRGVAPQYVEDAISSSKPILQQNENLSYTSGSLQVITNQQGAVVTLITH